MTDYAALAQQFGGSTSGDAAPSVDYGALAKQFGGDPQPTTVMQDIGQGIGNLAAGAVRGAGSIGATILAPWDMASDALAGKGLSLDANRQRRAAMDAGLQDMGAQPDSWMYKGGKLASEIAGTAGIGGVMANGLRALPIAGNVMPKLASAIESGGFATGAPAATDFAGQATNAAIRVGGGAVAGGAMAGMVNPDDTKTGLLLGGAMPVVGKIAGSVGSAIGKGMSVSPEVAALAQKAESLGIDIPADRLADSPLLNAGAASLKYMPFSGRAATETQMNNQIKKALSNTFGEDTEHLSKDLLAQAQSKLGAKFDSTLTNNTINVDQQLWSDLQGNLAKAKNELSADNYRIIENQVKDLWGKINNGEIDGKAAYNVKKTLDRLGRGNGNEAFHAKEVRNSIMDALDRSLTPADSAAFAQLRRQYGNMKSLEKLAGNSAEGDISMARLGNIDSHNQEVKDLAQIAATFAKGRESPHGAMQRVAMGSGVAALGGGALAGVAVPVAAGLTAGRLANTALNSNALRNLVLNKSGGTNRLTELLANPATRSALIESQSR